MPSPGLAKNLFINPIYTQRKGATKAEEKGESEKEESSEACVLPSLHCSSVKSPPAA